jgi:hypothetical protein
MTVGFASPGSYDRGGFDYPGRPHTVFAMRPEHVALLPEEWWPRRS